MEPTTTVSAALVTALTTVANNMTGAVVDILPVAATALGTILVVTFGIKAFKKFTK